MQRRFTRRPIRMHAKACGFCESKTDPDYKTPGSLTGYLTERGKIMGAGRTGICSKHQRRLTRAIKRARFLAILPFLVRS